MLALNPFSAMASALVPANVMPGGPSFSGVLMPMLWLIGGGTVDARIMVIAQRPLYQYTIGIYAWLTVVLYLLSTQLVKPVRRFRFRIQTWVIIVLVFAASILWPLVFYNPAGFGNDPRQPATPTPAFFPGPAIRREIIVPANVPPPPMPPPAMPTPTPKH